MTKILIAQLGARKHYQEPALFYQWRILDCLYTDFYFGANIPNIFSKMSSIYNWLPGLLKKALDRHCPSLDGAKVIQFPDFAFRYRQLLKKAPPQTRTQVFIWAGQEFARRIIRKGVGDVDTIYGFNGASLELFEYAKKKGIRCILDQTLAELSVLYKLLEEEEVAWPGWSLSPFLIQNSEKELLIREQKEQDLADHIICGSNFVKETLTIRGINEGKISVIPLGGPKDHVKMGCLKDPSSNEKRDVLKILFAGTICLRKGIPYLLEALRQLKARIHFICKAAGPLEISIDKLSEYKDVCQFLGTVSRAQMKTLYRWADVFILPSICEGSAMVAYEALSEGTPVITTYNAGTTVRNGLEGFIVPIKKIEPIVKKLIHIYEMPNSLLAKSDILNYLQVVNEESEKKLKALMLHD